MNIRRKVTYLDGSVSSSDAYGEWIPLPASCVSPHVLDQLAELESVGSSVYVVDVVPGQGMFEYIHTN